MFIEIDETCEEELIRRGKEVYTDFFCMIATEIRKGLHYFFIKKSLLEKLYKNNDLGCYAQTIYEKLFQNSVQDLSVQETINIRLKIVGVNGNSITVSKDCIVISLDIALELNFSKKVNLLCENLSDCKFFELITKIYMNNKELQKAKCNVKLLSGGGGTTYTIYEECINDKEITFLIVDTDVKYHGAAKGGTLKKLKEKEKEKEENIFKKLVEISELNMHEVENLIPLKLIKAFYDNSEGEADKENTIMILEKMKNIDGEDNPLNYFDMKNGIIEKKMEEDEQYREYWTNILSNIGFSNNDLKLEGFGPYLLRKIYAFMEKRETEDRFFENYVDDYMKDEWERIAKRIYSYGCSRERLIS